MYFISTSFTSRYPPTNNQLRTTSNPRNFAIIQDGRVTVQTVLGRQTQGYVGSGARSNAISTWVNINRGSNTAGQAKVIRFSNYQEEIHMARKCTKPKRPRNLAWFKDKMLLAEALESWVALDKEQMAFLADNGGTVTTSQESHEIPTPTNFQTDDLDVFDSDCDEAPSASAVLMAKLSAYDLYMSNQVAKHNEVDKVNKTINESLTTKLERYKEQIKIFEERQKYDLNDKEKYIDGQLREVIVDRNAKFVDFQNQIHTLKLQLSATIESHKTLSTTVDVLKKESKAKEDKSLEEIIDLEKKKKALDNVVYKMGQSTQTMHMLTKPQVFYDESHKTTLGYRNPLYLSQAQRKVPALYCGQTIVKKHDAVSMMDTEET
ncbi:hypothetical protein Tco_0668846 [Tanacetum coccineum]